MLACRPGAAVQRRRGGGYHREVLSQLDLHPVLTPTADSFRRREGRG